MLGITWKPAGNGWWTAEKAVYLLPAFRRLCEFAQHVVTADTVGARNDCCQVRGFFRVYWQAVENALRLDDLLHVRHGTSVANHV